MTENEITTAEIVVRTRQKDGRYFQHIRIGRGMLDVLRHNLTPEGRMVLRRAFEVRAEHEHKAMVADNVIGRIYWKLLGGTGILHDAFTEEEKEVLGL